MFATIESDDIDLALEPVIPEKSLATVFKEKFGYKYCFSTISGIEAFRLSLNALQLEKDDQIIIPAYTCDLIAKEAAKVCKVIFADIELDGFGLAWYDVREKTNKATKVIVTQHLFGFPSKDIEVITGFARKNGIFVIEDCAQAMGVTKDGQVVGTFGDLAIFSFGRTKTITSVVGGLIATNNSRIASRIELPTTELSKSAVKKLLEEITIGRERNYVPRDRVLPKELEAIAINQLSKLDRVDKILGIVGDAGIKWFKCLDRTCVNARWAGRNFRIVPKYRRV